MRRGACQTSITAAAMPAKVAKRAPARVYRVFSILTDPKYTLIQ